MSKRDWCFYTAVIGGVIALLLGLDILNWATIAHLPGGPAGNKPHAERHSDQPNAKQQPRTVEVKKAQAYDPGCPYPKDREDADLCEQRRMAKAAEDSAALADSQWWISFVQAVLSLLAVAAAAFAAIEAGRAARAAAKSADVAESALRITQRAYISVEPLGIRQRKAGTLWYAHVGVRNVGLLPARDVQWQISIQPFITDNEWHDLIYNEPRRGNHVIPPGTTMPRGSRGFSVNDRYQDDRFMYVWGEVTYTDGFGVPRYTRFCHRYNVQAIESYDKSGRRIPAEDARYHDYGNEAT